MDSKSETTETGFSQLLAKKKKVEIAKMDFLKKALKNGLKFIKILNIGIFWYLFLEIMQKSRVKIRKFEKRSFLKNAQNRAQEKRRKNEVLTQKKTISEKPKIRGEKRHFLG